MFGTRDVGHLTSRDKQVVVTVYKDKYKPPQQHPQLLLPHIGLSSEEYFLLLSSSKITPRSYLLNAMCGLHWLAFPMHMILSSSEI